MDAPGNGVLIFLAALVPVLALGALLTDLLLAAAPRRGKRPDVNFAPPSPLAASRPAAPRHHFGLAGNRATFVAANVVLAAGSLACGSAGRMVWATWLALFTTAAALLLAFVISAARGRHAGQMKK